MTRNTMRLAAVGITTAAGMFLAPATASAHSSGDPMAAKMRGHHSMADALRAHPELGDMTMGDMHKSGGHPMAAKMRGHHSMADALRAHPELGDMTMGADVP